MTTEISEVRDEHSEKRFGTVRRVLTVHLSEDGLSVEARRYRVEFQSAGSDKSVALFDDEAEALSLAAFESAQTMLQCRVREAKQAKRRRAKKAVTAGDTAENVEGATP